MITKVSQFSIRIYPFLDKETEFGLLVSPCIEINTKVESPDFKTFKFENFDGNTVGTEVGVNKLIEGFMEVKETLKKL